MQQIPASTDMPNWRHSIIKASVRLKEARTFVEQWNSLMIYPFHQHRRKFLTIFIFKSSLWAQRGQQADAFCTCTKPVHLQPKLGRIQRPSAWTKHPAIDNWSGADQSLVETGKSVRTGRQGVRYGLLFYLNLDPPRPHVLGLLMNREDLTQCEDIPNDASEPGPSSAKENSPKHFKAPGMLRHPQAALMRAQSDLTGHVNFGTAVLSPLVFFYRFWMEIVWLWLFLFPIGYKPCWFLNTSRVQSSV